MTTTDPLAAEITAVLTRWRESVCPECYRPYATAADWETMQEGEGAHLCWEPRACGFSPADGKTEERRIAEVVADVVERRQKALLLALRDARDALTERGDICTAQAAEAYDTRVAYNLEGEAEGRTGGALAINAIITRFWGREATL